jgi:hypothetical protein
VCLQRWRTLQTYVCVLPVSIEYAKMKLILAEETRRRKAMRDRTLVSSIDGKKRAQVAEETRSLRTWTESHPLLIFRREQRGRAHHLRVLSFQDC